MNILGISSFYHDAAACLMRDGRVVAAASEERFTRKKHDHGFPQHAIDYCLKDPGCSPSSWTTWPSTTSRSSSSTGCWKPILVLRLAAGGVSAYQCRSGWDLSFTFQKLFARS